MRLIFLVLTEGRFWKFWKLKGNFSSSQTRLGHFHYFPLFSVVKIESVQALLLNKVRTLPLFSPIFSGKIWKCPSLAHKLSFPLDLIFFSKIFLLLITSLFFPHFYGQPFVSLFNIEFSSLTPSFFMIASHAVPMFLRTLEHEMLPFRVRIRNTLERDINVFSLPQSTIVNVRLLTCITSIVWFIRQNSKINYVTELK